MNNNNIKIADFKNVCVSYGDDDVLQNINLSIQEGEHTVILGANGSGKSTLIKLFSNDIYSRIMPDSHKKIFGQDRWNISELKGYLGIITNDLHSEFLRLSPDVTGAELVISSFFSSLGIFSHQEYTQQQAIITSEILQFLQIESLSHKPISQMSTGQLRKFIIARALVHNPIAILLDEPTTGLDIKAQYEFIELMRRLSSTTTIILITHHIDEIFDEIQNVVLLKNGTIVKAGNKKEILTRENIANVFDIDPNILTTILRGNISIN